MWQHDLSLPENAVAYMVQQVAEDAAEGCQLIVRRVTREPWHCQRDGCGQINQPQWTDCVLCGTDRSDSE